MKKPKLNSVFRGSQDGLAEYQYKCTVCGHVVKMTTDLFMRQMERLVAENRMLREELERKK